jgi:hypothetical protein
MIVPIGLFFMVVLTSGAPAQEEEEIIFANTVDDSLPTRKMDIKMPNSHPQYAESYLCTAMKLDSSKENYIVGFEPNATSKTAHHMLLYGCKTPGKRNNDVFFKVTSYPDVGREKCPESRDTIISLYGVITTLVFQLRNGCFRRSKSGGFQLRRHGGA